jgi:hypothetical protein
MKVWLVLYYDQDWYRCVEGVYDSYLMALTVKNSLAPTDECREPFEIECHNVQQM